MNYNYDNETPRHGRPSAHRTQRIRRQNQTLMAIAVTFVLLLLVFAILLSITAISSIGENNPPTNDTPSGEQPDNTPPAGDGDQVPDNDPPADDAYTITLSADRIHEGELILINRSHVYPFPSINLVNVYMNQVAAQTLSKYFQMAGSTFFMERTAYIQMDKFLQAMNDPSVMFVSAHRTAEQQSAIGGSIPATRTSTRTKLVSRFHSSMQSSPF
jgi:hypothetical protein